MARTKDRYKKSLNVNTEKEEVIYKAAIYTRLSQERKEAWREKSSSIEAQEIVCKNYATTENIKVVETYIDYEKSGTNFDREGYKQMMEDVRNRKINCIIVRDLSRLGREHLEMGRLIDKVFPFLGVRFISVNDNLDTLKGVDGNKSFEVVLKNIVNDMYAKDISVKIKSTKMNKAKKGYFIGSVPPYGYKVVKTKEGQILEVDESVRWVVEKMFSLALDGFSQVEIARQLNLLGVATAMNHYKTGRVYREPGDREWTGSSVGKILVNEKQYGAMSQGKQSQYLAENEKLHVTNKDEWIVVENTHEGIVSKDTFEKVQKIRNKNKADTVFMRYKTNLKKDPVNRYENLVYRKNTDEQLYRRYRMTTHGKNEPRTVDYIFINKRGTGEIKDQTDNIVIMEYLIDEALYKTISSMLKKMKSQKELLLEMADEKEKLIKTVEKEIVRLQNRVTWQKDWQRKLYESYVFEKLDRDEYKAKKEESNLKIDVLTDEIARYENQKTEFEIKDKQIRKWIKDLYKAKGMKKLSKELIYSLVERIEIGEDKSIRVKFKFSSEGLGGMKDE